MGTGKSIYAEFESESQVESMASSMLRCDTYDTTRSERNAEGTRIIK
jgi:hypothetical protein